MADGGHVERIDEDVLPPEPQIIPSVNAIGAVRLGRRWLSVCHCVLVCDILLLILTILSDSHTTNSSSQAGFIRNAIRKSTLPSYPSACIMARIGMPSPSVGAMRACAGQWACWLQWQHHWDDGAMRTAPLAGYLGTLGYHHSGMQMANPAGITPV
jgi:hypothetical protein